MLKYRTRNILTICLLLVTLLLSACSLGSTDISGKSESDLQGNGGINGKLESPKYDYESIVNAPGGIVHKPDAFEHYYTTDGNMEKEHDLWKQEVYKAFKSVEPVPEDASEEQIDRLFNQILYVSALDYEPVDTLERYPYMVFKKDGVNPFTKKKIQENVQVNLEIVLDASGSMAATIGQQTMMEIAKQSITDVVSSLPPTARVGLRVFGHKGDNSDSKREESCGANELVYPLEKLNVSGIQNALQPIQPTGWTSIAKSIENGTKDLENFTNPEDLNILYIVTDGIETCGGDPVEVAKKLKNGKSNIILGIIGFNVDASQNALLKQIAEAGGGYYARANDASKLAEELQNIKDLAYSDYKWEPFTELEWTRLKGSHGSGKLFNSLLAGQSTKETNDISATITVLMGDNKEHPSIFKAYGKVWKGLDARRQKRHETIKSIYEDKIKEIAKASDDYIASLRSRIGEIAASVGSSSRIDRWSKQYKDKNERAKTIDAANKDLQQIKDAQAAPKK